MIETENIEFNRENFYLLIQENKKLSTEFDRLEKVFSNLQAKYQLTKDDLDYLKRQLYGRKSERFVAQDPGQLSLELEQMAEALQEQATEKIEYERKKAKKEKKPGHGRMLLPSHLRREETIIEPEDLPKGPFTRYIGDLYAMSESKKSFDEFKHEWEVEYEENCKKRDIEHPIEINETINIDEYKSVTFYKRSGEEWMCSCCDMAPNGGSGSISLIEALYRVSVNFYC